MENKLQNSLEDALNLLLKQKMTPEIEQTIKVITSELAWLSIAPPTQEQILEMAPANLEEEYLVTKSDVKKERKGLFEYYEPSVVLKKNERKQYLRCLRAEILDRIDHAPKIYYGDSEDYTFSFQFQFKLAMEAMEQKTGKAFFYPELHPSAYLNDYAKLEALMNSGARRTKEYLYQHGYLTYNPREVPKVLERLKVTDKGKTYIKTIREKN